MEPLTLAALGTAGANLLGQGVNAMAQGSINRKTQRYNREMYNIQKADNIDFWNMQNSYNSPAQQMERLKSAGLNPNLVYGASAPGNSSGQVHSATPSAWSPKPPEFDLGSPMSQYFSIATQSAQLDNIHALNAKIKAETDIALANAGLKSAELSSANDYFSNRALHLGEQRIGKSLDNDLKLVLQNPNASIDYNPNIKDSISYKVMFNKFQQSGIDTKIKDSILSGKSLDNTLKSLDIDLKKNGINPNDPVVMRLIGRLISQFVDISTLNFK